MAAPSGVVWGSIVGGYGRIGIYVNKTTENDKISGTVEIWFKSKYSVSDTSNTLYYDNLSSSGSATTSKGAKTIKTTVASGTGWSTSNEIRLGSYSFSHNRGTSASTRYLYAKLTNVDRVGGTMTVSTTLSIPALPKYTVSYNANGGTGAPSSQTKWYDKDINLQPSTKNPTRSGYTFMGWGTSKSDTSADYSAGATYSANKDAELFAVWKKTLTLSYDKNGGDGAPASQSATIYNATTSYTFTVSTAAQTRDGHSFLGWSASKTATSATYAVGSSSKITVSSNTTLYAVWKPDTYKITYYANGGTDAPAPQIRTYGQPFTLTIAEPKRTNYNFLGWSTSPTDTTAMYKPGASYAVNQAASLYAVWELAYFKPSIFNIHVSRMDAHTLEPSDSGTVGAVYFEWKTTYDVESMILSWTSVSGSSGSTNLYPSGTTSGIEMTHFAHEELKPDVTYNVSITIADSNGSTTVTKVLPGLKLPIDAIRGDDGEVGVSFGGPAEKTGVADFKMDANFNKPVYGNVFGLNKLPEIPAGSNFDNYLTTGVWGVYSNANAKTIYVKDGVLMGADRTVPPAGAGRLEVSSSTGQGYGDSGYAYVRQRYICATVANGTWERDIARNNVDGVWTWTYGAWVVSGRATSWRDLTIASSFSAYSNAQANMPKYKVSGSMVNVRGILTPVEAITLGTTLVPLTSGAIESAFRPEIESTFVCQGSGINRWTLTIKTDGKLYASRYGTNASVEAPTNAWFTFNVTYSI